VDRATFCRYKKELHDAINASRQKHVSSTLAEQQCGSKISWRILHSLMGKHILNALPDRLTDEQLASDMNNFLINKPKELWRSLATTDPANYISPVLPANFHNGDFQLCLNQLDLFTCTTTHEVKAVIKRSAKKSYVSDPIPTWLLVKFLDVLLPAVTAIINTSMTTGFPNCWKHSLVKPLLKKPNLDSSPFNNYRPVANLPYLSKIAERIIAKRLNDHLVSNQCLDPQQSGYRQHHSCQTALLYFLNAAFTAMDNGKVTLLILLDLSAAFDCVDHNILLKKLSTFGVNGTALTWFAKYLSDRAQSVVIGNTISPKRVIKQGVPQGSVLGPILFIIYLTGIREIILRHNFHYVVYADDVQLFQHATPTTLGTVIKQAEDCLTDLKTWFTSLKLTLNAGKTETILIGTSRALMKSQFLGLSVGGCHVTPSSKVRSLGVIIDQELNFDSYVSKIRSAAFCHLRLIARSRKCISRSSSLLLVNSFVMSHLNFCPVVLCGISNYLLDKLQAIPNSAIRLVYGIKKFESISTRLKEHKWLPVAKLFKLRALVLLHHILTTGEPRYLFQQFQRYAPVRDLRSRDSQLLCVPRIRRKCGESAFSFFASRLWNDLPLSIRLETSFSKVDKDINNFYLD
jgi:hypothetical protein